MIGIEDAANNAKRKRGGGGADALGRQSGSESATSANIIVMTGREFKALFDSALDGVAIIDDAGRYVDVNQAACALYGVPRTQIVGRRIGEAGALGSPGAVDDVWRTLLERGEHKGELRVPQPDGSLRDVEYTAKANFIPGRHLAILRDVTERKRVQSELQRRFRELESANKELEAFSYSVSHDLRAPLMNVEGYADLLLEEYADALGEIGREYVRHICASADRMTQVIDALLRLSQMTRADLQREPIDLSAAVAAIATTLRHAEPGRSVQFVIAPSLVVQGDRRLLSVALENLLSNAWKFTQKKPDGHIEFGADRRANEVVYFVRDNGAGFNVKYAHKLFGPFQRLHSQQEFPGTGIGLATVRRIIQRHGGRVWAEGAVGEGATFSFTL